MKILFVGQLGVGQTSRMRMESLRALGHEVIPLDTQALWQKTGWLSTKAQHAFAMGPTIDVLNEALVALARQHRPALVWGEKQEYLRPQTLRDVKKLGARLLHFTPDPYFTLAWKRTRLQDANLPIYDVVLNCKRYEEPAYRRVCTGQVIWMPLGFHEDVHRPMQPVDRALRRRYDCEVGFIGGWEPRRERLLDALAKTGEVAIWGYAWDHLVEGGFSLRRAVRLRRLAGGEPFSYAQNARLGRAWRGGEIYGEDYAWALSSSAISVGFLRTICPDQHTTRSFEIPACRSLLIADRTDEHRELFEEGKEAEFFSSEAELVDKVRYYRAHPAEREQIADAGYRRCHRSGYSYRERLAAVLEAFE